jgi:hypothetical protein
MYLLLPKHELCHIQKSVTTAKQGTNTTWRRKTSYQDIEIHS